MLASFAVLGCVLLCVGVAVSPLPSAATLDVAGPGAAAVRRTERRFAATVLLLAAAACVGVFALSYGHARPLAGLLALAIFGCALLHPWQLVRSVLIPFGLVRAAYTFSALGGQTWARDPRGGAVLAGALAALSRRRCDPAVNRWLLQKLHAAPLAGAGVVAAGLLAAERGDRATAADLLASLDLLDPAVCPPTARRIAFHYRIADAAQRGDWAGVRSLAELGHPLSRTARLFVAVATRAVGQPISNRALAWAWLVAPRRRHTWRPLKLAIADPRRDLMPLAFDSECAANEGPGLAGAAVSLHLELPFTDEPLAVKRSASAWDRALYGFEGRARLRARALGLGCSNSFERQIRGIADQACRDLAHNVTELPSPPPTSGCFAKTISIAQRVATQDLRNALDRLAARRRASIGAVALEVWTAAVDVLACYERSAALVCDPHARHENYIGVEHTVGAIAAWLWNARSERALAGALSLWLMSEAERMRDTHAAAHHGMGATLAQL